MLRKFVVATILSVAFLFGVFNGIQDKATWNFNAKSWWRDGITEERIKNDTHGGETPQETLDLFIEALESRDFDLASKYFVLDQQEDVLEDLSSSTTEQIDTLLGNLHRLEFDRIDGNKAFFYVDVRLSGDSDILPGEVVRSQIKFRTNSDNLWKIEEL